VPAPWWFPTLKNKHPLPSKVVPPPVGGIIMWRQKGLEGPAGGLPLLSWLPFRSSGNALFVLISLESAEVFRGTPAVCSRCLFWGGVVMGT
jgi:hypothetical protein